MSDSAQPPPTPSPGEWLSDQMERRHIGVRRLADELGVTEKAIYEWRGDRTAISESRVSHLAAVLSVTELEARRGLGFWVPAQPQQKHKTSGRDAAELDAIITDLTDVLERFRRWRREGD